LIPPEAAQLVARAQGGDREAFDRLVDETYAMIYATAYRLTGDVESAADATQDAYVRAYNSLQTFRGSASFSTWMYRIVVNVSLDALRRRSRAPEPLIVADEEQEREMDVVDASADPHAAAETRELQQIIACGLQQLSSDHRAVLVLFDINGLSYEEIAGILNIPLGTVKSRLNRARLALRKVIAPQLEHSWGQNGPTSA
jgi:RNA polymerase sigma-70 factor (ECF subfamily)